MSIDHHHNLIDQTSKVHSLRVDQIQLFVEYRTLELSNHSLIFIFIVSLE
jgi:hypothetical protein